MEPCWEEPESLEPIQISYGQKKPEEETYRLRALRNGPRRTRTPLYVLERTYSVADMYMTHRVIATQSIVNYLQGNPFGRGLLQSVLHDLFWCLLDWRLPPEIVMTLAYVYIDPDTSEPRPAIRVHIPRHAALSWLDFWTDLEERAYQHVDFASVLIFVRRIDYGSTSIP